MRLLWILLPILAQGEDRTPVPRRQAPEGSGRRGVPLGALGNLFRKQPQPEFVVHQGEAVTLECVTNEEVTCTWRTKIPAVASGFLKADIPQNVDITARDLESKTDCTITINNVDDRYNGEYICAPFGANGLVESTPSNVIVAKKPASLDFLGDAANGYPLMASSTEPVTVQCRALAARPKAEIVWYLGNTQLYEGIEVEDAEPDEIGTVTSVSTLTHQFHKEDNGLSLRCRANHAGYDERDQDQRDKSLEVDVHYAPYRPEGNNIGKIYGFTAGQKDDITVNFTANPTPTSMSWRVGDSVNVPVGGQSLDGRFTAGSLIIRNASMGMYALALTIDPVELEDQSKVFKLRVENAAGASELEFSIGTGKAPPPAALGGAAIAGIIVALVALLLVIGLVAFGRSRGKWCFAAREAGQDSGAPCDAEAAQRATDDGVDSAAHEKQAVAADDVADATPATESQRNGTNGAPPPPGDTPV